MTKPQRAKRKAAPLPWYLLIHQLPPEPLYLRAKVRQRLSRVGAVALKKSVYVLPRREDCLEDLQWIAQEAISGGGEAHVCEARFVDEKTDRALVDRFRAERDADYDALAAELAKLREELRQSRSADEEPEAEVSARLSRARKQLAEIAAIDFFEAPRRGEVHALLASIERLLGSTGRSRRSSRAASSTGELTGKTWFTRRGIHIDRIASAWFVRRFLDPRARFRFGDPASERRRAGEIVFDAPGGDFTHEGDRCTFETLIARTGVRDPALAPVAEIVHDIDLKDGKFGRPEAAGVERLVSGLVLINPADAARLERGILLFDELYQSFKRKNPVLPKEVSR